MPEPEPAPPPTVNRLLRDRDRIKIKALGVRRMLASDAYHQLIELTWPRLSLLFGACFILFNLAFAGLFHLDPAGLSIADNEPGIPRFWREFFFSVHTVATIGYGNVVPISLYANIMVVIEITLGILFFALTTGIAFSRFSHPTARIQFSRNLIVRDVEGMPTLMLRAANQRHNLIYAAQARLSLLIDDEVGGIPMRRFVDLKLARNNNPVFTLTWVMMHPIDQDSPLLPWFEQHDEIRTGEILVVVSGFDEHSGQTIHGRSAYGLEDIVRNVRFADILGFDERGARTINYAAFDDVVAE